MTVPASRWVFGFLASRGGRFNIPFESFLYASTGDCQFDEIYCPLTPSPDSNSKGCWTDVTPFLRQFVGGDFSEFSYQFKAHIMLSMYYALHSGIALMLVWRGCACSL